MYYYVLKFCDGDKIHPWQPFFKTELPQNRFTLLTILAAMTRQEDLDTVLNRKVHSVLNISEEQAMSPEFAAQDMTIRRSSPTGDFFVAPGMETGTIAILFQDVMPNHRSILRVLAVPTCLLAEPNPEEAVKNVLCDIAAECLNMPRKSITQSDICSLSRREYARYNIYPAQPDIDIILNLTDTHTPLINHDMFEADLMVPWDEACRITHYLKNTVHQSEDEVIEKTVTFPNGMCMSIKCCGTQDPHETSWTEAILFLPDGEEVKTSSVTNQFFKDWTICDTNGVSYTAHVRIGGM